MELDRAIDQTVTTLPGVTGGPELLIPIAYDVSSGSFDTRFVWSFVERWKMGGNFSLYESNGSFSLETERLHAYLEIEIGEYYVAHLGFRTIDYNESLHDFDDYNANIAEFSIGCRW